MKYLNLIRKIIKVYKKVSVQDILRIFAEFFNGLVIEIKGEYPYES